MAEELEWSAFDIIDILGWEMDLMYHAQDMKWKAYFTPRAYEIVKADPESYIYEKDGHEYVKVWDNNYIPFVIHMRIAGIEENMGTDEFAPQIGCRRMLDL